MSAPKEPSLPARLLEYVADDLRSYASEYRCGREDPAAIHAAAVTLEDAVTKNDVVVLAKRGCGPCALASKIVADAQATGAPAFSAWRREIADDRVMVAATTRALAGAWTSSFPIIFVRGKYIGGSDELKAMHADGRLASALSAERAPFAASGEAELSEDVRASLAPSLLRPPRGAYWPLPQWYGYANVLRGQAAAHVVVMAALFSLSKAGERRSPLATVLTLLLLVDFVSTALNGPAPLAPFGAAATRALWFRRGAAVNAVPYKLIYVGYFYELCGDFPAAADAEVFPYLIFNSVLLAVFRL